LQRADVAKFVSTYFKAPRMILAAAGGFETLLYFFCQIFNTKEKLWIDGITNNDSKL